MKTMTTLLTRCLPMTLTLLVLALPLESRATCISRLKTARPVSLGCAEIKGKLSPGATLYIAAIWEVCCSAPPPRGDGGMGTPDISCAQYPWPQYGDPIKDFKLVRLEAGGKETKVAGNFKDLKKECGSARQFSFDGTLVAGARYRLSYFSEVGFEVEVGTVAVMPDIDLPDGGYVMDCLADGAPPEEEAAMDRGCSVRGRGDSAGVSLALVLLGLLWARRRQG